MRPTKELFVLWQKVRDGTLSRPTFVKQMEPIRAEVESLLLRGYFNARVSGFCKGLWEHRPNLWTFVEVEGVSGADEQCRRAGVASGGDLAKVVVRCPVVSGEPVCRAVADSGRNLPAATAGRVLLAG
jgi:hypothetical protein